MAKKRQPKERSHSDSNLHIYIQEAAGGSGNYIEMSILLKAKTTLSVYDKNLLFEWEGKYKGQLITVSLQRYTDARNAIVSNTFPNGRDINNVFTHDQLQAELERVLGYLN